MQNQEYDYTTSEPTMSSEHQINNDPREQGPAQNIAGQENVYHEYSEGYRGINIWGEGEKLRPGSESRTPGMNWIRGFLMVVFVLSLAYLVGNTFLSWLSWAFIMVLVVGGTVVLAINWRVTKLAMPPQTFQMLDRSQLVIRNMSGNVVIRRGETGQVTVAAVKRMSGIGMSPETARIFYELNGSKLDVTTRGVWNWLQFGFISVDLELTVPETCDVQLSNGSGKLYVDGIKGEINLKTGSGRIEVNQLSGQVTILTGSGSINANNVQGRIALRSGSGRIVGSGLQGSSDLKTGSGRIEIERSTLAGTSRFVTGSGSISYEGALQMLGNYEMKTGSGSVHITLPADAAFSLNAKTGSGKIVNEFGSNQVGNEQRTHLKVRTGSGSVHIYNGGVYRYNQ
jgi:Putative adhesin